MKQCDLDDMGCTSSSPTHHPSSASIDEYIRMSQVDIDKVNRPTESILQAYQRMDEEVCTLERTCPGPRLATAEAWIDHLESLDVEYSKTDDLMSLAVLPEKNNINQYSSNSIPNVDEIEDIDQVLIDNSQTKMKEEDDVIKVRHLTVQLGVVFDKEKASVHEEFLARVSRNIMMVMTNTLRFEMIEHSKQRRSILMESYNKLRYLYAEQDALISAVSNGTYLTKLEEKLDNELETSRQIRDKLGSVAEQWRTSGALLHTSAKASIRAVEFWNLVGPSKDPNERVSLALDCRSLILSSLAAFEGAQSALPQVDIPFVSPRQISAVRHANVYLLTDMANESRYQHTKDVFEAYQSNTNKAVEWLHETYKKTLRKDLDEGEDTVLTIAKKLRQERVKNFSEVVGNRMYIPNSVDVR